MSPCVRRDDGMRAADRAYRVGFGAGRRRSAGRLIGDARVMRAIGQAGERLAAAEEEFRARGIADRPVAGGLVQFQQRQPLAHRHHIVEGDRIRLHLDFEGVGQRGVAARDRARHPHHVLGRAGLALPRAPPRRGSWRGRKDQAGGPCRSRHFASHFRVPRRSGWPKVRLPRAFFSCSTRSSDQVNTVIAFFPSRRAGQSRDSAGDAIRLKNPCGQNPLALAGRENRARTCTPYKMDSRDQNCRTRCRTRQPKGYNMA